MSEFQGFGRDLQAAFDAAGDTALAQAFKAFTVWFGPDAWADGLWDVQASKDENGATLSVSLVKADAYVAPVFPTAVDLSAEQTAAQAVAQQTPAEAAVVEAAPVDAASAAGVVPVEAAAAEAAAPADPSSSGSDASSSTGSNDSPAADVPPAA